MISIKTSARVRAPSPELLLGLIIVSQIMEQYQADCVITSGADSDHSWKSAHWDGRAVDIRSQHVVGDETKVRIVSESQYALGQDYDFILEDLGRPNEHYHLEFDPKGRVP